MRRPVVIEQQAIWRDAIEPLALKLNGEIDVLTAQFSFGRESIVAAGAQLREQSSAGEDAEAAASLWDICRNQSRRGLENLAQRIEPAATWDDLVLPAPQRQILREMASHVRQRVTVYEQWGFSAKGSRGLGISALFAGASGTGKTMAAEVLANELRLDLYRIDLARSSANTSARRRRICAAFSTPPRKAARSCFSTKPTRCSANAAKSRTATTATPTSR